jgi:hypothetical protein
MNRFYILFLVVFFVVQAKAQDVLITNEGDVKTVYDIDVSSKAIFYKLSKKVDAPIQKIDKSKVLMIKHHDGTKQVFENSVEAASNSTTNAIPHQTTATVTTSSEEEMAASKAANDALIAKYNSRGLVSFINDKMKGKKQKANSAYLLFHLKRGSIIADNNIELNLEISDITIPYLLLSLKNKSDKTIYIDLGNTFFVRGDESTPYYVPSSTSQVNGKEGGGSINVGSVASALGVGGMVGTIANGVNVGGSTSSATTTTTYTQRVVAIPPMSTKQLDGQILFPLDCDKCYNNVIKTSKVTKKIWKVNLSLPENQNVTTSGDTKTYAESDSPINFGSYITYSLDENLATVYNLNFRFFVQESIGLKFITNLWTGTDLTLDKELSSNYKNQCFLYLVF